MSDSPQFLVTARKWRPNKFEDVVGQEHITTTLKNAINSGRIHHAYLFCGPRGVGKTTTARIYARAVNCLKPTKEFEPCNECESCLAQFDGRSMDIIEIDGASNNSVDDIRKLRDNSKYPPSGSKYKMYIIDEVHMLSTAAFNALLKTLEEPPPHLMFVFATTESHKVPATIISRCQRFDFRRMEIYDIVSQLSHIAKNEGISIDEESLITVAKKGDGSMRDSQSIFDQAIAFCGKDVTFAALADALHLIDDEFYFRITDAIKSKNYSEMFNITYQIISKGYDLGECLRGLLEHLRNILTLQTTNNSKLIESSESVLKRYESHAKEFSQADIIRYMNLVVAAEKDLKFAPQPRIRFELSLIQLASLDTAIEIRELINEVRGLKASDLASSSNDDLKKKLN